MKSFLFGLILGVLVVPVAVVGYFVTGKVPVGTAAQAMPFEKILANRALHARMRREMPKAVPIAADETNYLAGTKVYRDDCAVCHGMPTGSLSRIAYGMFPKPPQLFHGKGVTDDEPGETYWKVANGIRLTGMPGFKGTLTPTQMWQVSLLLANANKLPDSVKQALAPEAATAPAPAPAAPVSGP